MEGLSICINTQTPLLQFLNPPAGTGPGAPATPDDLSLLVEGVDYQFSPGGVARMVRPLVRELIDEGFVSEAHWVSLNPVGPPVVHAGGLTLHHVTLGADRMASYGKVKEALWSAAHGMEAAVGQDAVFWSDDFSEYAYYNRRSAERIVELDRRIDFDAFYIHDFQQLPVGQMLGTLKPKVFRWHIPFDRSMIPDAWGPLLATYFNSYDAVIVSCRRYLDALKEFGFSGRAWKLYPYVDPAEFQRPGPEEVSAVARRFGLDPDDQIVLTVARMDPMKGQDRVIQAVAQLKGRYPKLRLVLVGNGSFSSSKAGVGLSKGALWRAHLEELSGTLGLVDRVIFAGHVDQPTLDALYERAAFTVLPSVREGFGLVVTESWLHHRAAVITERAGIAELVQDGKNGLLFDPDEVEGLADRMERLLTDPAVAQRLGDAGAISARRCTLAAGVKAERKLLTELL